MFDIKILQSILIIKFNVHFTMFVVLIKDGRLKIKSRVISRNPCLRPLLSISVKNDDNCNYEKILLSKITRAQEFAAANCKEFYAWQDGRSEVEFVRNIEGDILPIEVKSGNVTHAKSLQKFIERYGSKYRTIMSGRQFKIDQRNGVHNYPLYLAGRFPVEIGPESIQ